MNCPALCSAVTATMAIMREIGFERGTPASADQIEKAKKLIEGSALSLTQISLECGFCDQAHFCHMFTRSVGVNPMTWRSHQFRDKPGVTLP